MNRRRLLVAARLGLVPTLSGCIEDGAGPNDDLADAGDGSDDGDAPSENGDEVSGDDDESGEDDDEGDDTTEAVVEEEPRVDEPPHEIEAPDVPADADYEEASEAWDEEYLGEGIETEPSLSFEEVRGVRVHEPLDELDGDDQYRVLLVGDREELEAAVDLEAMDESPREEVEAVDFETSIVVLVDSGYGSGSVRHRWVRAEEVDEGVHLHGYYTVPYERTDDLTSRRSTLLIDRPESPDLARVSLTVSEDRRVHFNSTEGVVTVEE